MGWLTKKYIMRIAELENDVSAMRRRIDALEDDFIIRVGDLDYMGAYFLGGYYRDTRPKVSLKDAIKMLVDNSGLEFVHTSEKAKTELKPKEKPKAGK